MVWLKQQTIRMFHIDGQYAAHIAKQFMAPRTGQIAHGRKRGRRLQLGQSSLNEFCAPRAMFLYQAPLFGVFFPQLV